MDKKKLIEYTEWMLKSIGVRDDYTKKDLKSLTKMFLKQNPDFFDEPDVSKEIDEEFESLQPNENQSNISQTGSFIITYQIKELPYGKL